MKAYSEELRQKVVQAVQQHGTSKSQATRLFDISFSYLKRYTRLAGRGESLTPRREVADPHQSRPNHKETARRRHTHMTDGHRDGIPHRPGRSTVLSHEGDTKPLGLGAPGPALHKAIYRGGGFAAKVAADPKGPFLNQKSPS